jgi:WD40 repeat protein
VTSSVDGSLVASGSWDGMLAVYDTRTGNVVHFFEHSIKISSIAFSPTAPILAFGPQDRYLGLWFYTTDRIISFAGHSDWVDSVAFSSNGR